MAWWQKLFNRRTASSSDAAAQQISTLITSVLHEQRFLGEVLLQLPRQFTVDAQGPIGLVWNAGQLSLEVNPALLSQLRSDEACLLLEHAALHVIWEHPVRYANYPHPDLAKLATDVAVNQYLPATPTGTASLEQVERLLRKRLPEKQDSQDYLAILGHLSPAERERLRQAGYKLNGSKNGRQTAPGKLAAKAESHAGWRQVDQPGNVNQQLRLTKLRQLVQRAWRQTPQCDRGLLPGAVRQQLTRPRPAVVTPLWQQILRQQLGNIAAGRRESAARFNRRQPLRMDLPGQVSRLVPDIDIFIDNSGSVPDSELSAALAAVDQLTSHYRLTATVYTFDARVHSHSQRLRPGMAVKRERHGGGGTSFQSIFDFLRTHHVSKRSVVVIITDGWGEATLRDYHYRYVDWLLTTKRDQLSVSAPANRVFELKEVQHNE
ncbi:vWA domain-containing protein [Limosilactobacillus sp.]|uniref:vWA domain-containing protein n=1 Tax=Limosilactobacillus sp. TaxID=2773925 RepID=UPI003F0C26BA